MILDIIVTHYKESWLVCRPFFDMLNSQRGIDFHDFRVLLVHDGTPAFPDSYFAEYQYEVVQYTIEHAGVSAARNKGLNESIAKWVQFCDCDDTYTGIYALRAAMSCMDIDADYMWSPFFVEYMKDGDLVASVRNENIVWIHAKYFRRKWLLDNDLWFPVGIHYSEDSAFGALVNELVQPGRSGKIKTDYPIYTWVYRADSVSVDPANEVKNVTGFLDRNFYVVKEFKRRKLKHTGMVARMFADAYWAFHQRLRKFPEQEAYFIRNAREYYDDLRSVDGDTMFKILQAARNMFSTREMDTTENFWEWIGRIEKA